MNKDLSVLELVDELVEGSRKDAVMSLWSYLQERGFSEAPASSQHSHHNAYKGGLLDHSKNVTSNLLDLVSVFSDAEIPVSSCFIVGMFHDCSKCCDGFGRQFYLPNVLASGKVSGSKPYESNKDITKISDAYRAAMIVCNFVPLFEDEIQAICHHDYLWVPEGRLLAVNKVAPLTLMLHFADMWAGILQENTTSMLSTLEKRNLVKFCLD